MKNACYLKRILLAMIAIYSMFLSSVPVFADNDTTLRVAYYPLHGFFEYDEQGIEVGYGVEILDKISQYTGIKFTYVKTDSWEATKAMLLNGEADIRMPGTMPSTPSTTLGYTQHGIIDTYYALLCRDDRQDLLYNDYESFSHLRVGISKNLYDTSIVREYLNDIGVSQGGLVFFDGYNECKAALDNKEVDALISNVMDMDTSMKILAKFATRSNYISMTINNPYLSVLNEALSNIKMDEPTFISNLYSKWFPERITILLTKAENEYLQSIDSICFSFCDGQGYLSHRDEAGNFVGFYPSFCRLIAEKLGKQYRETGNSATECADTTVFPDCYYDISWAMEKQFDISKPYITVNYYELTRRDSNIDKAKCHVAAVEKFRATRDLLSSDYKQEQMVWCNDYEECIEAVYSGKADITFMNSYAAEYYLSLYRFSSLTVKLTDHSHQVCMGVHKDNDGMLSSIISKIVSTIPTDAIEVMLVESTSNKPKQNFFVEWIYQNPKTGIAVCCVLTAILISLVFLALFVKKTHKENLNLQRATNAKQDFLSQMSHDMRTPMNAIIGYLTLAKDKVDNPKVLGEYLDKTDYASKYLLSLINDVLDMSKLDSNKLELHETIVDGPKFLEDIAKMFREEASKKGIILKTDFSKSQTPWVVMDELRSRQIYSNLLNNAIKFSDKGTTINWEIEDRVVSESEMEMVCVISDQGCGMSRKFMKSLFKPFEQEQNKYSSTESGTGLGLSIVKNLVELMNGTITVESELGKGSTFTICLKRKISHKPQEKKEDKHSNLNINSLNGRKILLCEDHPLNQEIAVKLLEKVGAYVVVAENGLKGVEAFSASKNKEFSAVLMDIRMPVMDGITATKKFVS